MNGPQTSSTTTVMLNIHVPPKPKGWCVDQGVEHSWKDGASLMCDPPIHTRECVNCGQRQWFKPGTWEEV